MEESKLKIQVKIFTSNDWEKRKIGNRIHEQLRGNEDYINNNIILNIDEENEINLYIFEECEDIPKITI